MRISDWSSDVCSSDLYTPGEIEAACEEARHRQTYVAAHAYSPEAIRMAVKGGVHSIEHGNMIDAGAAAAMIEHGATLVPRSEGSRVGKGVVSTWWYR